MTDAMAAMGLADGVHALGPMRVCVRNGTARLDGTTTLAGRCGSLASPWHVYTYVYIGLSVFAELLG